MLTKTGAVGTLVLVAPMAVGQTLRVLPRTAGMAEAGASCISDDGRVVGGWSGGRDGAGAVAVLWVDGEVLELGRLPGGDGSGVSAVSADGRTAAGSSSGRAFWWTAETGIRPLPRLNSDTRGDWSTAMSADGTVIVGSSGGRSVRWQGGTTVTSAGLPYDGVYNSATGVSDDGSVVVGIYDAGQCCGPRAVRWTARSGPVPFLNQTGVALGISGDGRYVVGAVVGPAFRWSSAGGLEFLHGPGGDGTPERSNADGSVIVGRRHEGFDPFYRGMLWTARTGVVDFQRHAAARGVDLSGVELHVVTAVSRDGRHFAGVGVDTSGASVAWVLDWPCAACPADADCDGSLSPDDLALFAERFGSGGDFDGDGFVDFFDYLAFLDQFERGC